MIKEELQRERMARVAAELNAKKIYEIGEENRVKISELQAEAMRFKVKNEGLEGKITTLKRNIGAAQGWLTQCFIG